MHSNRFLPFARSLALLSPLSLALGACNPSFCDQSRAQPEATALDGGVASASAAAQCAAPGEYGSPCAEEVRCGPHGTCCGQHSCERLTLSDGGAALQWRSVQCIVGPLSPPSLDALA